ncbi:heme oxygenase-like protein [Kribbella orskensis]|uniref:Heme oxygenase-like protein n=1 Tax=Kribbella orskensis TaxID=2512216 RepID=A0ABY2BNV2_9ACTN|nr:MULTISPECIES: iron-containing redox enzyme family protein [Kribbella]TCN41137.1 heme oxygenase-like protein [Kribbella sp. VKM Ac-2500]TCO24389.1 heme oxygenase-like protein [Kribbella orskensis]
MLLPPARGPLSAWLIGHLTGRREPMPRVITTAEPWSDEDLQLALWCCNELSYRGFDDAPPDAEWDLRVLEFRAQLEEPWTQWLRATCTPSVTIAPASRQLRELIDADTGAAPAAYLHRHAELGQFREFVRNRSVYQLKEADPHSFGIPRLDGATKAALVEIQADEYGGGRPARMHAELFRTTMRWLGLDDSYGRYVPEVPAVTLAISNVMSLFALHSRWTGALLGHLAALEMTSTLPNRRYAAGAARLGATEEQAAYFTEHVEADAVHEQIAAHNLCDSYVLDHPGATADILFGAQCSLTLDNLFADHLLTSWGVTETQHRAAS